MQLNVYLDFLCSGSFLSLYLSFTYFLLLARPLFTPSTFHALETAYHPGDDMEQFELEMHERHSNFFKDVQASSIETWCEKSRFGATKEVKRVGIDYLPYSSNVTPPLRGCPQSI